MHPLIETLENRRLLDAELTFFPVADTHARDGAYASANYGAAAELHVKKSSRGYQREAFMKFDLSAIDSEIASAKLRLLAKLSLPASGVPLTIQGAANVGWSEGDANWNNRPATNTAILAQSVISTTGAARYEFDVTQYVRQMKNAGATFVTLVLKNNGGNNSYTAINSGEAAVGRPELRVETNTIAQRDPGFILSEPILHVPEGARQTFTVRLAAWPSKVVRGGISFGGDANLSADQATIEFTPGNWNIPQIITVSAAQDADSRNGVGVVEIRNVADARLVSGVYVIAQDDDPSPGVSSQTRISLADAFVRDSAATTNYGASTELVTKDSSSGFNREAYLRFDISDYTPGTAAKLRVFGKLSQSAGGVTTAVYGAADNWSESTLTWRSRPATLTGALASQRVSTTAGQWYEFDVTSFVEQQRAASASTVTLALKNLGGNSSYTIYNSGESISSRPELVMAENDRIAIKVHSWSPTPYANINAMVRVNRNNSAIAEAEKAAPLLARKAVGDRVLLMDYVLPAAFNLNDPLKFYGKGPFIADDVTWSRAFFGKLAQLNVNIDRLVFDREAGATLFHVENKHGVAKIPTFIAAMFADPACRQRLPAGVTQYSPADFALSSPKRVAAYTAFNQWANERYYLQAFRDAYVTPARDALGPHVKASEFDATRVTPGFYEAGGEWPHLSGSVSGTSSPLMYLAGHEALPTLDARRDYRLSKLKSSIDAAKAAGEDVLPWISSISFDLAAEQAGGKNAYTIDPMFGVDYMRRMIDLGVTEFLYWNPATPYRDANTILRDDAIMAAIADE